MRTCSHSGCVLPATVRGYCNTHYTAWRLAAVRAGTWKPKRKVRKATLSYEESVALDRILQVRAEKHYWAGIEEILGAVPKAEKPVVAKGIRRLLDRKVFRFSLYPTSSVQRRTRHAILEGHEEEG